MNFKVLFMIVLTGLMASALSAQIAAVEDVPVPKAVEQGNGAIQPFFWVGGQAVESIGYNFQTGAGGIRLHSGDTWFSFNLAFVDSHYNDPKKMEVGKDRDTWSGHLLMKDFTLKINSWEAAGTTPKFEVNLPSWMAEIQGQGFHFGLITQAGDTVDGTSTTNNPTLALYGANKVLNISDITALSTTTSSSVTGNVSLYTDTDFINVVSPNDVTYAGQSGIMYAGFDVPDRFSAYLSVASEGNIYSPVLADGTLTKDGWAFALDFGLTPLGIYADEDNPFIFTVEGNAIAGVNYADNDIGFGLLLSAEIWLAQDLALKPLVTFDGKIQDTWTPTHSAVTAGYEFLPEFGWGLQLDLSQKRFVSDEWGEKSHSTVSSYLENAKIQKYAYVQILGMYSWDTDVDMAFKFEEPDGIAGFDDKLGAMAEVRLNNLAGFSPAYPMTMSAAARVSYSIADDTVIPYLRAYLDNDEVFKLRVGAQACVIPYVGFEIAYSSGNLNGAAANASGTLYAVDSGRIEFITIISTSDQKPKTPKKWEF